MNQRFCGTVSRWGWGLLVTMISQSVWASVDGARLQDLLPAEVYTAAGLEKLSDAEQQVLARWLAGRDSGDGPLPVTAVLLGKPEATTIAQPRASERASTTNDDEFLTNVLPPFDGWSGKTMFYLENGQVWQQRMDGFYRHKGDDFRVSIKPGMFGFYHLKMVSSGRSVGVKRIR